MGNGDRATHKMRRKERRRTRERERERERDSRRREGGEEEKSAHHVVPDVKVFVLFLRHFCVRRPRVRLRVVLSLGFYLRAPSRC